MKNLIFGLLFISGLISFAGERTITTSDGVELHVTVKGEGIPCLYLHGGPGSGSWWLEKFMGDSLEKRFQMIYLDQRGVSRSTSPQDGNYSLERMVMDFEEVRIALGIDSWITMGHSFGGILQMGYAERHPAVIKGMIMINATLSINESFQRGWCPKGSEFAGLEEPFPCMDESRPVMDRWGELMQKVNETDVFWKMGYSDRNNMEIMNTSFGDIPNWNWDFGNAAMDVEDYWKNFKPYTSSMEMPVLFYYGRSDWMVGPHHYRGVNFPNLTLWGADTGHMPFMESQQDLIEAIDHYIIVL